MFLREDIGLISIFQLGLFDEAHLVQLTKSLSLIGRNVIKAAWSDLKNVRFSFRLPASAWPSFFETPSGLSSDRIRDLFLARFVCL